MPIGWHLSIWVGVAVWALCIYALSSVVDWNASFLGFAGTILTLVPGASDLLRRYYVKKRRPAAPADPEQRAMLARLHDSAKDALSGFEPFYAALLLLGVSLIALGFAEQFAGAEAR